jgi:hypothetical protein
MFGGVEVANRICVWFDSLLRCSCSCCTSVDVNDLKEIITLFLLNIGFPSDEKSVLFRYVVKTWNVSCEWVTKSESSLGHSKTPHEAARGQRREESPMAPKRKPARAAAAVERDPDGIFRGVSAFFIPHGVQSRRLEVRDLSQAPPVHPRRRREFVLCAIVLKHLGSAQVWKQRLVQMGGHVQQKIDKGAPTVNHVLAMDAKALLRDSNAAWLHRFRGVTAAHLLPSN